MGGGEGGRIEEGVMGRVDGGGGVYWGRKSSGQRKRVCTYVLLEVRSSQRGGERRG